ncbi:MAG TPA: hypothetical protein DCE42_21600 [Myxococcales bacterium]|nr:hypothetical protein [Deltaproteobacteria bacterium]MBU48379.1 hypothetical protein [Deltaproteobacteria bacterium]HAA57375.1 hypothetical protein [Myxococcales bacterium]
MMLFTSYLRHRFPSLRKLYRAIPLFLFLGCCLCLQTGCVSARINIGPTFVSPQKNIRTTKENQQLTEAQKESTVTSTGLDMLVGVSVPVFHSDQESTTFLKNFFKRSKVNWSGVWLSAETGLSLDLQASLTKFVLGGGIGYGVVRTNAWWKSYGAMLLPYFIVAGAPSGTSIGLRGTLRLYALYSAINVELQYEPLFMETTTHNLRVMFGIDVLGMMMFISETF